MLTPYTEISAIPLSGGCITRHHKALLPFGSFSDMKNLRGEHPSFRKRPGQIKLHTTADSTNEVLSLYQFRKERISEKHFLAQMSDGVVMDATSAPPTVTTGVFGSDVFTGSTGQIAGSWSTIDDILIHSNGVDQHQTYTGTANYVSAVIVFAGSAAPANVPVEGTDYTIQATDGLTSTVVVLDSLNTYGNNECIFICTPVPATSITFTVSADNDTDSVATMYYRKSNNSWTQLTNGTHGWVDGTIDDGETLAVTGSMAWTTQPSDEIPMYMYGQVGFWYQIRVSIQLDSNVELTKITFGSGFQNIVNTWDGVIPYAIEAMFYDQSSTAYLTYATGSITLSDMVRESGNDSDDRDRLYFSTADPIQGIYVDVGATPNTATSTFHVKVWTGAGWTEVSSLSDGTNGFANSGWITWARNTSAEPTQFQSSQWYAYWYYLYIEDSTADFSSSVVVSIQVMPYFDIEEIGKGYCNAAWKDRAAYTFTLFPNFIYVSAVGLPTSLNGTDYGILRAGDGRTNKTAAMRKFHNELLVFQEEKGVEGGTITLFQGYSPDTFGKLLISSKVGTMNNKSVAVVDGVLTATKTDERIKTLCFALSRYGVIATDGLTVSIISDDIQNYFDPTKSEYIRRGYESKMWLAHDSAFNVLRIGLVTSTSRSTGTTTSTSSNKLVDTEGAFTTDGTAVGDTVKNTTDSTSASVTAIDSASILSIDSDIMTSSEAYSIVPGKPNVFPVFDLTGKTWSFDTPAQELSCMTEVEADSGDITVLQAGGGIDDGFVYLLNNSTNDVSTAIDSFFIMELNARGEYIQLIEMLLRAEAVAASAGDITVAFTRNTISAGSKTLSMSPEITNQTIKRHRFELNIDDQNISIKVQNATASKEMRLLDMGLKTQIYKER